MSRVFFSVLSYWLSPEQLLEAAPGTTLATYLQKGDQVWLRNNEGTHTLTEANEQSFTALDEGGWISEPLWSDVYAVKITSHLYARLLEHHLEAWLGADRTAVLLGMKNLVQLRRENA